MEITGGCLCRAVRFRSTAAPLFTRACWCRVCQYLGAGSGTVTSCFLRGNVSVQGPLSDFSIVADSGNVMHRRFCTLCGTPLFSEAESRPHLIFIRAGALDDPGIVKPTTTIWVSQAPAWACMDPELPKVAGQPPPPAAPGP